MSTVDPFSTPPPPLGVVRREPLRVYWAARVEDLGSLALRGPRPQDFVTAQEKWDTVKTAVDAGDLPAIVTLGQSSPRFGKLVAEAVYEAVRAAVLPEAPSRLTCLYAALGATQAVEFGTRHNAPPVFDPQTGFPVSGTMGVPATTSGTWVALDMNGFQAFAIPPDDSSVAQLLRGLEQMANAYWRGIATANPFIEVLAEELHVEGWPLAP